MADHLARDERAALEKYRFDRNRMAAYFQMVHGVKATFDAGNGEASPSDLLQLVLGGGPQQNQGVIAAVPATQERPSTTRRRKKRKGDEEDGSEKASKPKRATRQRSSDSDGDARPATKRRDWSSTHPAIVVAVEALGSCKPAKLRKHLEAEQSVDSELLEGTRLNSVLNVMVRNGLLEKEDGVLSLPGEASADVDDNDTGDEGDAEENDDDEDEDDDQDEADPDVSDVGGVAIGDGDEEEEDKEDADDEEEEEETEPDAAVQHFEQLDEERQTDLIRAACQVVGRAGKYFSAVEVSQLICEAEFEGRRDLLPEAETVLALMTLWGFTELEDTDELGDENTKRFKWRTTASDRPVPSSASTDTDSPQQQPPVHVGQQDEIIDAVREFGPCTIAALRRQCGGSGRFPEGFVTSILAGAVRTLVEKGLLSEDGQNRIDLPERVARSS